LHFGHIFDILDLFSKLGSWEAWKLEGWEAGRLGSSNTCELSGFIASWPPGFPAFKPS
jgi:hypothetical protein